MAKLNTATGIVAKFYDSLLMDSFTKPISGIKYKKKKVPTYLTIKVPLIKRHECSDDGWLIYLKEIRLFKIGSHFEKVPYYPKTKGKVITFKRYSPLSVEEKQPLK